MMESKRPQRHTTRTFPPYAYIPGMAPHPRTSPQGHAYGSEEPPRLTMKAEDWARCDEYLYAVDLYNYHYFWESHEYWEALWHGVNRKGKLADLLKSLIQTSAAHIKIVNQDNYQRDAMSKRSREKILEIAARQEGRFLGIDLASFCAAQGAYFKAQAEGENADFPFIHLGDDDQSGASL